MRLLVCITLLFICLATLPSVHCQNRKYKLTEYNEKDRTDTKENYSKQDVDNQKYKKLKYRGKNDDDEETTEKRFKKKELKYQDNEDDGRQNTKQARKYKEEANDEVQRGKRYNKHDKNNEEEMVKTSNKRNRLNARKLQESDEDDDTDEDNDSEVCTRRKGKKCESAEDGSDETEEVPVKKQVTYVKKFAHEKQKTKQDREIGNIMKIHKRSNTKDEYEDSSEEVTVRKRGRFIWGDDEY